MKSNCPRNIKEPFPLCLVTLGQSGKSGRWSCPNRLNLSMDVQLWGLGLNTYCGWMVLKPVVNNGINYQPQLVSRMSSIIAKLSYSDSLDHWLPFLTEAKPVKPPWREAKPAAIHRTSGPSVSSLSCRHPMSIRTLKNAPPMHVSVRISEAHYDRQQRTSSF